MANADLFIVGVPGMGNSDPSWHQRRPFGFSRSGQSKTQARNHALRRPSTASGRLSSSVSSHPCPRALGLNGDRSEYWGIDGRNDGLKGGNGFHNSFAAKGTRPTHSGGRPSSARCRGPSSFTHGPTTDSSYIASATPACTRNRAGIVRGGGREGRAAPPPIPPMAIAPAVPSHNPRPPQSLTYRRRPSTAGETRLSCANPSQFEAKNRVTAASSAAATANDRTMGYGSRVGNSSVLSIDKFNRLGGMNAHSPQACRDTSVAGRYNDVGVVAATTATAAGAGQLTTAATNSDYRGMKRGRSPPSLEETPEATLASRREVVVGIGEGSSPMREGTIHKWSPMTTYDNQHTTSTRSMARGHHENTKKVAAAVTAAKGGERAWAQCNTFPTGNARDQRSIYDGDDQRSSKKVMRQRPHSAAPPRTRDPDDCGSPSISNFGGKRCNRHVSSSGLYNRNATHGTAGEEKGPHWVPEEARTYRSVSPKAYGRAENVRDGTPAQSAWQSLESMDTSPAGDNGRHVFASRPRPQSARSHSSAIVPDYILSEKQVLRFFGHLTEELDWGNGKNVSPGRERAIASRMTSIRQVVVYLFLADGSLEISETRQVNSGQQGGMLLKRNIFKKRNGSVYGVGDLKVGTDLKLLGRSYRLTDCDDYTRKWYQSKGLPQARAEPVPPEIKQCLRVEHSTGLCNPQRPHTATSRSSTTGRVDTSNPGARREKVLQGQRFFTHAEQILRFKAVWEDPSVGGTVRRYDLFFYLQDETVALFNPREDRPNSGRDEGPVYVRRQRLPKDWRTRAHVPSEGAQETSEEEAAARGVEGKAGFMGELDLAVGRTVYVWGRKIKLVGCDSFTQHYYRHQHGIDMELSSEEAAAERSRAKTRRTYRSEGERRRRRSNDHDPHHNHDSSSKSPNADAAGGLDYLTLSLGRYEEDRRRASDRRLRSSSRGSTGCREGGAAMDELGGALPPDRYKGRRIRCKAILDSELPNDKGREFVVTYDLGWDTLMVHELQRRNSGRPGGLFLVKGRHRRPGKNGRGRYYTPQDLFLGATVPLIMGQTLIVTEMDRSSLTLCEEFSQEFPLMDCERVLRRITQRARNMRLDLRGELRRRATAAAQEEGHHALRTHDGVAPTSNRAEAAAAAMVPGWTAGKVFVDNNRREAGSASTYSAPAVPSHARQQHQQRHPRSPARHKNCPVSATQFPDHDRNIDRDRREIDTQGANIATGRRIRSGATWGLVGGWGDDHGKVSTILNNPDDGFASQAVRRETHIDGSAFRSRQRAYHGNGNFKNHSATAPWATVQGPKHAATFAARASGAAIPSTGQATVMEARGTGNAARSGGNHDRANYFGNQATFLDAMDTLGLLVGVGQQEVLTLVRAFVIKGGRILWASMCDKMSCISVEDPVDKDAEHRREDIARARSKGGVRLHETAHGMPVGASVETNLSRRMRETSVAWRRVFTDAEGVAKGGNEAGVLGVATLVHTMRRNGFHVGADDASFFVRRFAREEGSKVDYHALCDSIYPCDFSPTRQPNESDHGNNYNGFESDRYTGNVTRADEKNDATGHMPDTYAMPVATMAATKDRVDCRAPGCDFEIDGGASTFPDGDGGGGTGEQEWSLWKRNCHPEKRSVCRGEQTQDVAGFRATGESPGSSEYWDEGNATC